MNYTIIGHTADSSYHDRCGDYISEPGKFEVRIFSDDEDQKAEFLKAWAHARFHSTYEDLVILFNGASEDHIAYESDEYYVMQDLEREMEALLPQIKAEHEEAERIRKEAAANAAVEQARQIAARERAQDLAKLQELQRKLGLK